MVEIRDRTGASLTLAPVRGADGEGWSVLRVEAVGPWFQARFEAKINASELESIVASLETLHGDLSGAYRFETWDGWLHATFAMGKRGDLAISLVLQDHPDLLHELRVYLNVDQSFLPDLIRGFRELLEYGGKTSET